MAESRVQAVDGIAQRRPQVVKLRWGRGRAPGSRMRCHRLPPWLLLLLGRGLPLLPPRVLPVLLLPQLPPRRPQRRQLRLRHWRVCGSSAGVTRLLVLMLLLMLVVCGGGAHAAHRHRERVVGWC